MTNFKLFYFDNPENCPHGNGDAWEQIPASFSQDPDEESCIYKCSICGLEEEERPDDYEGRFNIPDHLEFPNG